MKDLIPSILLVVFVVFLISMWVLLIAWLGGFGQPPDINPGDPVTVLTGRTVIQEDKPCQENLPAFVSATDPDGHLRWFRPGNFFSGQQEIAVIFPDGTISWVVDSHLLTLPADAKYILCPSE